MKKIFAFAMVAVLAVPLLAADGAATFQARCAGCHGPDGTRSIPAMGVKPLNTPEVKQKGAATLTKEVTDGVGKMPPFGGKLSADEISAAVGYVLSLK
jgi:cytochrome c6